MANENPQNDLSGYSDPIYDKLEGVNNFLARYWRLLALTAIIIIVALVIVGKSSNNTAQAQSASAYIEAAGDADKLKAVSADETVLPEYRFQAANDLVQQALDKGDLEQAKQHLSMALAQAKADGSDRLKMYAAISAAAIQSEAGDLGAAIESYNQALSAGRNTDYNAAIYLAQFNKAQLQVQAAVAASDQAEAKQLRSDALASFDQMRLAQGSAKDLNGSRLQKAAEYSYYALLREFPALANDLQVTPAADLEAVKTTADDDDDAAETTEATETNAPAEAAADQAATATSSDAAPATPTTKDQ